MTITEIRKKVKSERVGRNWRYSINIGGLHITSSPKKLDGLYPVKVVNTGEVVGGVRNKKEFCDAIKDRLDQQYEDALNEYSSY